VNYYNKIRKITISRSDEVNTGRFPSWPTIQFPSKFIHWLSPAVGTKSTRRYKNKKFRKMFLLIFLYFSFFKIRSEGHVSRKQEFPRNVLSFFPYFSSSNYDPKATCRDILKQVGVSLRVITTWLKKVVFATFGFSSFHSTSYTSY